MEKTTATQDSYQIETTSNADQRENRDSLTDLFNRSPLPEEDKMFNLGMYTRSTLLVKFLVMDDLYKRIVNIPGNICEFGTWWGQNLVLMENLRAIHEPFNKQRVILGFDTFEGYTDIGDIDRRSDVWKENSYSTGTEYMSYLEELLETHEGSNVLGHIKGVHKLIKGNVTESAPKYFDGHKESLVALAYFDMGLYEPTKAAMLAIKPNLMPGSIMLLDELTWAESPGEAIAFKEVFNDVKYKIEKVALYPSKSIVTIL